MPIQATDIKRSLVVIDHDIGLSNLQSEVPPELEERLESYLVARLENGKFLVAAWPELIRKVQAMGLVSSILRFDYIDNIPPAVDGLELSTLIVQAESEVLQRYEDLVNPTEQAIRILLDSSSVQEQVVSALQQQTRKRLILLFFGNPIAVIDQEPPVMLSLEEIEQFGQRIETLSEKVESWPRIPTGVLSDDEGLSDTTPTKPTQHQNAEPEAPPASSPESEEASDDRVINAILRDSEGEAITDEPLSLGETYELRFNIDKPSKQAFSTSSINIPELFKSLPTEQETIEITVLIESDDFIIHGADQASIKLPRTGKSKNSAIFSVEPKRNGKCHIRVLFIANNRMFQRMTLELQVGKTNNKEPQTTNPSGEESEQNAAGGSKTMTITKNQGTTLGTALNTPTSNLRHLSILMDPRDNGYQMIVTDTGTVRVRLNLTTTQINEWVIDMRAVIKDIVYTLHNNQYVYQIEDTTIPPEVHQQSLAKLAKQGYLLYNKLFNSPSSTAEVKKLGKELKQLSQKNTLKIDISSEQFVLPWTLLYDGERPKEDGSNVSIDNFWGFKHQIAYLPEFKTQSLVSIDYVITPSDQFDLSFVCNNAIDGQMQRPLVADQSKFLKTLTGVQVNEYPTRDDLYALLTDTSVTPDLIYFYCHAVSNLPGEKGGVAGSKLVLTDGAATLDDLNFAAPLDEDPLSSSPLVFLNCCQSAELSPFLYDGIVPYLLAKGARGVLGTEVDTPAVFAAEFAKEFLTRFLAGGVSLGDLLHQMRREYALGKNNVMGLVYSLYSHGELYVAPQGS